jgi:hypothetical protein
VNGKDTQPVVVSSQVSLAPRVRPLCGAELPAPSLKTYISGDQPGIG